MSNIASRHGTGRRLLLATTLAAALATLSATPGMAADLPTEVGSPCPATTQGDTWTLPFCTDNDGRDWDDCDVIEKRDYDVRGKVRICVENYLDGTCYVHTNWEAQGDLPDPAIYYYKATLQMLDEDWIVVDEYPTENTTEGAFHDHDQAWWDLSPGEKAFTRLTVYRDSPSTQLVAQVSDSVPYTC